MRKDQFKREVIYFQGIQFMLTELSALIEEARSLVHRVVLDYDASTKEREGLPFLGQMFATDTAFGTAPSISFRSMEAWVR